MKPKRYVLYIHVELRHLETQQRRFGTAVSNFMIYGNQSYHDIKHEGQHHPSFWEMSLLTTHVIDLRLRPCGLRWNLAAPSCACDTFHQATRFALDDYDDASTGLKHSYPVED
nr:hypothetical protein CFP56_50319 [Quercus suber]